MQREGEWGGLHGVMEGTPPSSTPPQQRNGNAFFQAAVQVLHQTRDGTGVASLAAPLAHRAGNRPVHRGGGGGGRCRGA